MIRQTLLLLALSLCPVLADRLPPDALELKGKRDAKVAEIDRAYAAALDKLQKKAMESGNLSAANEIQKEIERVTKNPFQDDSPKIEGSRWKWGSGGELSLMKGGRAEHSKWEKPGKWTQESDGAIRLVSDSGQEFLIRFAGDGTAVVMIDGKAGTTITATTR